MLCMSYVVRVNDAIVTTCIDNVVDVAVDLLLFLIATAIVFACSCVSWL